MDDLDINSNINPLIREKVEAVVTSQQTREFIYEILEIERTYKLKTGKVKEYEKALARYVRAS